MEATKAQLADIAMQALEQAIATIAPRKRGKEGQIILALRKRCAHLRLRAMQAERAAGIEPAQFMSKTNEQPRNQRGKKRGKMKKRAKAAKKQKLIEAARAGADTAFGRRWRARNGGGEGAAGEEGEEEGEDESEEEEEE